MTARELFVEELIIAKGCTREMAEDATRECNAILPASEEATKPLTPFEITYFRMVLKQCFAEVKLKDPAVLAEEVRQIELAAARKN